MSLRDSLVALLVPIFLGFGFVIAKPAFEYFPPFLLMGLRFTIAALIMIWWFPIPKGLFKDLIIPNNACFDPQYEKVSAKPSSADEDPSDIIFVNFLFFFIEINSLFIARIEKQLILNISIILL